MTIDHQNVSPSHQLDYDGQALHLPQAEFALEKSLRRCCDVFDQVRHRSLPESCVNLIRFIENIEEKCALFLSNPATQGTISVPDYTPSPAGFARLLDQIQDETNAFDKFIELGLFEFIKFLDQERLKAKVNFIEPSNGDRKIGKDRLGKYKAIGDRVLVVGNMPTIDQVWSELCRSGSLPGVITVLHHELLHRTQHTRGLLGWLADTFRPEYVGDDTSLRYAEKVLVEAHAFDGSINCPLSNIGWHRHGPFGQKAWIVTRLLDRYLNVPDGSWAISLQNGAVTTLESEFFDVIQTVDEAVTSVASARLLGASGPQIGQLVKMSLGFGPTEQCRYPQVNSGLQELFKLRELTDLELRTAVLEALTCKDWIEQEITRIKIRHIVAAESARQQSERG